MKGAVIFRLVCILALWILLCVWYVDRLIRYDADITLLSLSPLVISGIIVFVPLYRKYFKNNEGNGQKK